MKYVDNLSPIEIQVVNRIAITFTVALLLVVSFWVWRAEQGAELYRECMKATERLNKDPGMCRNY